MNFSITRTGDCDDCSHEGEQVPASYALEDGTKVCDSHLDIRMEG